MRSGQKSFALTKRDDVHAVAIVVFGLSRHDDEASADDLTVWGAFLRDTAKFKLRTIVANFIG